MASSKLKGLVTLVTGASSGLGRATVKRFVDQGSKVVMIDNAAEGKSFASSLGENNCLFAEADVTSEEQVQNALHQAKKRFEKLNVVINCAGIGIARKIYNRKHGAHSLEEFARVLEVNTIGTFNVIRFSVGIMLERSCKKDEERGVIINTSSIAAFEGQTGQVAYSASKGAIVGMTLPLARDLSHDCIRVCTIAPGLFETPLLMGLPEKKRQFLNDTIPFPPRLGSPDSFAHMCQTIVENEYMNGEVIRLDGALRMMY